MKQLIHLLIGFSIVFYTCKKPESKDFSDIPIDSKTYCGWYKVYKAALDSGSSYSQYRQTEILRIEEKRIIEFNGFLEAGVNLFAEYEGNSFTIYRQTVPIEINQDGDIDSITISGSGIYFPQSCVFKIEYEVSYQKLSSLGGFGRYYAKADECELYNYSYSSNNEGASISKFNLDYILSEVKYYPPPGLWPHDSIAYDAIKATREDCILRINNQRVYNNVTEKHDSIMGTVVPYENYISIRIRNLEHFYEPYYSSTITILIPK